MQFDLTASIQFIIIASLFFIAGGSLGWLSTRRHYKKVVVKLLDELTGLRANYGYVREDAHDLRVELKAAEIQKARLIEILESTSGHDRFSKVRSDLETARDNIQQLKKEINSREQDIFALRTAVYKLRQQKSVPVHPLPLPQKELPPVDDGYDDLCLIKGITQEINHKLRSMGIISYRQIAECTPTQLANIQKLIGKNKLLPLRQWVRDANKLFQKKYAPLLNNSFTGPLSGSSKSA